jgi:acyl dehydratase
MAEALTYDAIQIGQELGPVEHHVKAEMVRDYARATGDAGAAMSGESSPDGVPLAHPAMATIFSTALLGDASANRPSGGIHARQEYRFLAPLRVGARVITSGRVLEKYIRNGRKTVVYESRTVDERGVEVARCVVTSILPE